MSKIITNQISPQSGNSVTINGDVSIGGTLTYEDVTNIDVVGVITARSDVSIADKIVHTGDTNTAIRFPAVDTFTVETAGSERFRVDSNGAITATGSSISVDGDTTIRDLTVRTVTSSDQVISNRSGTSICFRAQSGGTDKFVVRADGKVGLNNNSPSDDLDINVSATGQGISLRRTDNTFSTLNFYSNRSDTEAAAGVLRGYWNNTRVCQIALAGGTDTTNKDDGIIQFFTAPDSGTGVVERVRITSAGAAIFKGGLAEKYENAGTTLGSQPNNPLSDGNVILFTGNESGNKTINFTGVHATLSNGETVSFTAIITPNNSGVINVVQVDGQAITVKWSGGSAPSAGASGQDIYTFQILKTGTGVSNYTVFGAATNYA